MRIYPYSAIPHRLSDAGDRDSAGVNSNREAGFSGVIANGIDYISNELSNT
jgi:hypothetical protein